MPLQNRVTPEGEIVSIAARGLMMGNRGGALHGTERTLGPRRWVSRQWICCVLSFNGRHRQAMAPGRYTELFFLDEATALAAGHRPCFECRRKDFMRFATIWAEVHGGGTRATAPDMDRVLHRERVAPDGSKATYSATLADLPDGSFVRVAGKPHLVWQRRLHPWSPHGYLPARAALRGAEPLDVLTPGSIVRVIRGGYLPAVHPSLTGGC